MSSYRSISSNASRPPPPPPPPPPRRDPDFRTRKNVSFACVGCKEARRKCIGTQPCDRCVEKSQQCIFNQEQDGRHKTKLKRQIQEHETHSNLLNDLLTALRDSSEEGVEETVSFIRDNSSLSAISQHLQERSLAIQSGPVSTTETGNTSSSADNVRSTDSEPREDGVPRNNPGSRPLDVDGLVGRQLDDGSPP